APPADGAASVAAAPVSACTAPPAPFVCVCCNSVDEDAQPEDGKLPQPAYSVWKGGCCCSTAVKRASPLWITPSRFPVTRFIPTCASPCSMAPASGPCAPWEGPIGPSPICPGPCVHSDPIIGPSPCP